MGCFDQDFQDSQKLIHQSIVLYCSMIIKTKIYLCLEAHMLKNEFVNKECMMALLIVNIKVLVTQ